MLQMVIQSLADIGGTGAFASGRTVEAHDLPVTHTSRRIGKPHTLVLAKTPALFERQAAERRSLHRELTWLEREGRSFG